MPYDKKMSELIKLNVKIVLNSDQTAHLLDLRERQPRHQHDLHLHLSLHRTKCSS